MCQASQGDPCYPSNLANLAVTGVRDLTIGYDSSNPPSFKPNLPLSSGNMITFRAKDEAAGQEVVLTIRYIAVSPYSDQCSQSDSHSFCVQDKWHGTQGYAMIPHGRYLILTKDTDQVLLGRPRKGYNVADHPAWKSRSCPPGGMVGGNKKQLVTSCITCHIWIGSNVHPTL